MKMAESATESKTAPKTFGWLGFNWDGEINAVPSPLVYRCGKQKGLKERYIQTYTSRYFYKQVLYNGYNEQKEAKERNRKRMKKRRRRRGKWRRRK